MVVPSSRGLSSPLERVGEHHCEQRLVASRKLTFVVEEAREGSAHPCTIADIIRLLELLPESDWAGLAGIVFRQPTHKQTLLAGAWGHLRYHAELRAKRGRLVVRGALIFLDAINADHRFEWSSALALADQEELERLRTDGHAVERAGNRYIIHVTSESARNTQLYRTLPHEIGHLFDWLEKVETPVAHGEDFSAAMERYFGRPRSEREAFAHRYADAARERLLAGQRIPFERQEEPGSPAL